MVVAVQLPSCDARLFFLLSPGRIIGELSFSKRKYVIDRIARFALEIARKRRGKLCSVDKANVLEASMLWRRRVMAIAQDYPDIEPSHMHVDNASMQLVRYPKQSDGMVTNNIFGDI
ncbi:hypothetical protein K1719_018679 [Acacia pycnantha]|nr:hypothetical protein K1719_018679 [Acacia pycnantha]